MVKAHLYEAEAICHATEDWKRVERALLATLPEELRPSVAVTRSNMSGHYGNPLSVLRYSVRGEQASACVSWLFGRLGDDQTRQVVSEFQNRFEGSKLHLRLSKPYAFMGRLLLSDGDNVVHVSVGFKGYLRNLEPAEIMESCGVHVKRAEKT
ncbi:MAG: RNA-binding domain-containing protein [Thermoprotei archaeon]